MQKVQKLLSSTDYELELIEESSFSQGIKIFTLFLPYFI